MPARPSSPRLLLGIASLVAFTAAMGMAAAWIDDGTAPSIRVADGRAVSVGSRWPGDLDDCVSDVRVPVLPNCYREEIARSGGVKQPWSTFSTAAFGAVGLWILAVADRTRRARDTWIGFVALAMGPGSALFHGTLTTWGGWGDVLSMYALLAFIVANDLAALRHEPERIGRRFWPLLAGSALVKLVSGSLTTLVFIAFGVGVGIFALVSWARLQEPAAVHRSGTRLAVAYGLLGAAIVPWVLSNPASGDPTWIPFHAAWHVLSAGFVGAYWWYLRSEAAVEPDAGAVARAAVP